MRVRVRVRLRLLVRDLPLLCAIVVRVRVRVRVRLLVRDLLLLCDIHAGKLEPTPLAPTQSSPRAHPAASGLGP
eukprot:scaffold72399_cov41-Phaeocystis_antarctica.AAC.2